MKDYTLPEMTHFMSIALEAALKGGEVLRRYWGKLEDIKEKSHPGNLVTEADCASEQVILEIIRQACPDHGIIAEESGSDRNEGEEYTWMIDPLDGTTNYTHQFPMVSVSIALLRYGVPCLGIVYNPILNELFQGAKGKGATLNGKKLSCSKEAMLSHSLLVTGFAYDRRTNRNNNYTEFCHLTHCSQGVRRVGSAALDLAYVAAGRFDGYWEAGLQCWDVAAGMVLVEEARGLVTAHDGSTFDIFSGEILATNGLIHESLSRELAESHKSH